MTHARSGNGAGGREEEILLARAEVARALGKVRGASERLDAILASPRAAAIVPLLPAEELFLTIKEVGLSDALELVHLASPGQFRAFVDMDAWRRERMDVSAVLLWLRAARTDSDEARFERKLAAVDMEVVELVLKKSLVVHDLSEDDDPEVQGACFRSPEGRYVIEFMVEGADQAGLRGLLDTLYAQDPFRAARLLEAVRWELPTELEEIALRWRTGRMADLGFPDVAEALSWWSYVDPDAPLPSLDRAPYVSSGTFLARVESDAGFLSRVVAELDPDGRDLAERQVVLAMNAAMVVDGADPGDAAAVDRAVASARDTFCLALEYLSRGDPARAAEILGSVPLKRVFQVGSSLALRLKFRADRLMRSGRASFPAAKDEPLLDPPTGEVIVGLRRRRPLCAGAVGGAAAQFGPFRDLADLARVAAALDDAERTAVLFERLGFDPPAVQEALAAARGSEGLAPVRFSDLLLTACARELLGLGFAFLPLESATFGELVSRGLAVVDGRPRAAPALAALVKGRLGAAAASLSPGHVEVAGRLAALCLARLSDEAGAALSAGQPLSPGVQLPLIVAP